jgi:hypothetical protein
VECSSLPAEAQDLLDRVCPSCGLILRVGDFPMCGGKHGQHEPMGNLSVEDDSCDIWIENMTAEPLHFESKGEWKRKTKELGLLNKVQHVPKPGTDKSPHTTRWI